MRRTAARAPQSPVNSLTHADGTRCAEPGAVPLSDAYRDLTSRQIIGQVHRARDILVAVDRDIDRVKRNRIGTPIRVAALYNQGHLAGEGCSARVILHDQDLVVELSGLACELGGTNAGRRTPRIRRNVLQQKLQVLLYGLQL